MKRATTLGIVIVALAALVIWLPHASAYERYNGGCQNCHGAFTDGTSTKGSVFPSDNKHAMHRASSNMNTDCDLCHTSGDGRDPWIGSSDGTVDTPGMGCIGCHEAAGLRAHHLDAGVSTCLTCHPSDPTPPAESVPPPYYGSVDTNADNSCNTVMAAEVNENWTVGDFVGLDNDGDGLYDANDPDCGTPGEVDMLLVTAHDPGTRQVTISYAPACRTTDNNFYWGPLDQVAGPATYEGQDCGILSTGSYVWTYPVPPASQSVFFLIVGADTDLTIEGTYGKMTDMGQRAVAALCPETQDLARECNQP